ncbi:MAG: hypothetical protein HDR83_04480 [Bacteroides sp.]|nr:hypothetical protein [Bacteroides sp.]
MKKFYTLALVAALTFSGASAKGDLSTAKVLDAKLTPAAASVSTAAKLQPQTLKGKKKSQNQKLSSSIKGAVNPAKVAAKAVNLDEWESIGEADYTDGILWAAWFQPASTNSTYKVPAYRSKTDANTYLLTDLYPESVIKNNPDKMNYVDYQLVDGKESTVILTVADGGITASYDLAVEESDEGIITLNEVEPGTYSGNTITFAEGAFEIFLGEEDYNVTNEFTIVLPVDLGEGSTDPETPGIDLSEWELLGDGSYTDGFLYGAYGKTDTFDAYTVQAYRNKTDENKYLLTDIFPTSYLSEQGIYEQTDGKTSTVIFTVNPENNLVTADYDINVTDTSDGTALTVTQNGLGTYLQGNIQFKAEDFIVNYDGQANNYSLAFDVILPGAKDLSFSLSMLSDICNNDNKWSFGVTAGSGISSIKYIMAKGIFSASDANLKTAASTNNTLESGKQYTYTFGETDNEGYYTLVVAASDAEGTVVGGDAIYFYKNTPINADEWVSLGQVDFTDDTFEPIFFNNASYPTYKVELLENKENPGLLCLVNPYANIPVYSEYFAEDSHTDCTHYIKLDATDATDVQLPIAPMGVSFGYPEDLSFESLKGGTLANGALTFPTRGLVVYTANLSDYGYYANQSGKFNLTVPNLLKVTVKVQDEPVEGATVTLADWSIEGITTDANGVAYISYPAANTMNIVVYKDGYVLNEIAPATTHYAEQTVQLEAEKASLTVTVTDEEYEPIAGAYVYFQNQELQTGENGQVKISDLSAPEVLGKEIEFSVYKDGYAYYEGKADFTETMDAYAMVTLTAEKASLTVIVTDEEYEPIAGAYVYFQNQELQTGENGQVKISDLSAPEVLGKEIEFSVYKDGYAYYEGKADFTETTDAYAMVTLTAEKASLTVMVFDQDTDEPIADAKVTFLGAEYTTGENGQVKISDINATEVLGKEVPVTIEHVRYTTYTGNADFTETIDAYLVATMKVAVSGIDAIMRDIENGDAEVYDLNGRRVNRPAAGNVYIVNGMKVLVK